MVCVFMILSLVTQSWSVKMITGNESEQYLGWKRTIGCAGDVNGDGYDDFIYKKWNSPFNQVYIVYGGSDITPDVTLLPAETYWSDDFGFAVSGGCDINNDTYDDVVVSCRSAYQQPYAPGRVYVYYGGPSMDGEADITITSPSTNWSNEFGFDVCLFKPFEDYPFCDILVGAPRENLCNGVVYHFFGDLGYVDYVPYELPSYPVSRVGEAVCAGDFDNDWSPEIIIGGSCYAGDKGIIASFEYANTGYQAVVTGPGPGTRFGWDLDAGDVNNDGYDDLFIGAYRRYPNSVYVSYGFYNWGNGNNNLLLDQILVGDNNNVDDFGFQLAYCQDINNDSYGDLLVGAPQQTTGGPVGPGKTFIYYGSSNGFGSSFNRRLTGPHNSSYYGHSVASTGNMNGYGNDDFAIGAPLFDIGGLANAGRIYIYLEKYYSNPTDNICEDDHPDHNLHSMSSRYVRIYPNPVRDAMSVQFASPSDCRTIIKLYDNSGRLITQLFDGYAKIGVNEIQYDGAHLASGVYFLRAQAGEELITEKVIFQR